MVPLVPPDFVHMLSAELRLRGQDVPRWELAEWTRCLWPHIAEDPDVWRWANEWAEARRALAT
jgi:hypothetical protein